jgi:hypothetical protein
MKAFICALILSLATSSFGMTIAEYQKDRMAPTTSPHLSGFMAGLMEYNRLLIANPDLVAKSASSAAMICAPNYVFTSSVAIDIIEKNFTQDKWYPDANNDSVEQLIA